MAKNSVTKLVPKDDQLPAELLAQYEQDAGQGVSTAIEDNLVPFVSVLQALSPQVAKRDPKYIAGAEAGDILMSSLNRVWKGETGLVFQPCAFGREFVEWRSRDDGGGFIGRHPQMPTTARQVPDAKRPERQRWVMPAGTEIIDTRYHFGFILNPDEAIGEGQAMGPMQVVLSLSSTGHTFSRAWMTQMSQLRLPGGQAAPSRARKYRITSVPKSNAVGNWFGLRADDAGWVTDAEQYDRGTVLFQSIRDGALRAAQPEKDTTETDEEVPF